MKIKLNIFVILVIVLIALTTVGFFMTKNDSNNTPDEYCNKSISQEKVIFIYSPGCHACNVMRPFMEKRDDIYWLNLASGKCVEILKELNLYTETIPTFICTKNQNIFTVGGRTEEAINNWIEKNC